MTTFDEVRLVKSEPGTSGLQTVEDFVQSTPGSPSDKTQSLLEDAVTCSRFVCLNISYACCPLIANAQHA